MYIAPTLLCYVPLFFLIKKKTILLYSATVTRILSLLDQNRISKRHKTNQINIILDKRKSVNFLNATTTVGIHSR